MSDKKSEESVDGPEGEPGLVAVVEPTTGDEPSSGQARESAVDEAPAAGRLRRGFPWFGVFNLLLILALAVAAGYYWQLQQKTAAEKQAAFDALERQVAGKAESSQLQSSLRPLHSGIGEIEKRIQALQEHQRELQDSSERLYELFGRDQSGWQLAEVEYLMRIAQHKLILENDFEGAALTLQAASDRIAATGDPGLLPVRVRINGEIADLKTRKRADLVGMALKLAQLGSRIRILQPGFQAPAEEAKTPAPDEMAEIGLEQRIRTFLESLVSVRRDDATPPTRTEALIVDVGQTLEDNLKLTRWSVLERDAFQYRRLMQENVDLFREFYNLDDAANHDFYTELQALQKAEISPEKPDIGGSFLLLRKIIAQREGQPAMEPDQQPGQPVPATPEMPGGGGNV